MTRRFRQINGELVEIVNESASATHEVMGEIQPYKSMITGEWITSRTQHREHLKKHGCKEVGNEIHHLKPQALPDVSPQKRKELIVAQVQSMSDSQFRKAVKREVDFVRWNSRER